MLQEGQWLLLTQLSVPLAVMGGVPPAPAAETDPAPPSAPRAG